MFQTWFSQRLAGYRQVLANPVVDLVDPRALTQPERTALTGAIAKANLVIYRCRTPRQVSSEDVLALGAQLGLTRLDHDTRTNRHGLAEVCDHRSNKSSRYIPFSNKALNWHTDGSYYPADRVIRTFILHCKTQAMRGGTSRLIDHAVVYGLLRQQAPELLPALLDCDAMTVPAHQPDGGEATRGECSGPVFFNSQDGALCMRYTSRARYIHWHQNRDLSAAVEHLRRVIAHAGNLVLEYTLAPGEGIICHNVLHARSGFDDTSAKRRLLYRARFREPIVEALHGGVVPSVSVS